MIFVLLLVGCISLSMPAQGQITIEPTNVQLPTAAGEDFVFDLAISDPCGVSAQSFQSTISITGSGLTIDGPSSENVDGEADYWLFGNSAGAAALDNLDDTYTFGDGPDDGIAQALAVDDLMARYIFEWDGTPGDFVFTLVTDISSSFVQDGSFASHSLALEPGLLTPSGENGFTVYIPEPATLMLFGLGSAVLLRKRRA
jgi:hypothetical protein